MFRVEGLNGGRLTEARVLEPVLSEEAPVVVAGDVDDVVDGEEQQNRTR